MAARAKEPPASEPTATVPTAGSRPLIGSDPPMPVASRKDQEEAWLILRRYRRQLAPLKPPMRAFVVRSLACDLHEEDQAAKAIAANGDAPYKETDEL